MQQSYNKSSQVMTTFTEDEKAARTIARLLAPARTKGELGELLSEEIIKYTLHDLQVIGGKLHTESIRLPRSYRNQISPYLIDQIFGGYHRFMTYHRSGRFQTMIEPISDLDRFLKFCEIIPIGCTHHDDTISRMPIPYTLKHRLFYYFITAFTMFIRDHPGHPVGTPFPGGFKVEDRNGKFYCLIRDKEKEIPYSICNFCPAVQADDSHLG
jgi:uncharacterized protein (UPF0305 family)